MQEVWKDVKGFEGVYEISNLGRLASHKTRNGLSKERNILSNVNSKGGYFAVVLEYKDKIRHSRIHRLVYEAFIGELPIGHHYHIHHKNHDKQDNRVENLELLSAKEHHQADIDSRNIKGMNDYNKFIKPKTILQYTKGGDFVSSYPNSEEAYKATGICARTIMHVCNGDTNGKGNKYKTAGGYIWKFAV